MAALDETAVQPLGADPEGLAQKDREVLGLGAGGGVGETG